MHHSVGAISANLPGMVRVLRMEHAALARDKTVNPKAQQLSVLIVEGRWKA